MENKEEKEMMKRLNDVSTSISLAINEEKKHEKGENKRELLETRFYSEFEIETEKGPIILNNVYITSERNKEGDMEYHFYWIKENGKKGEMTLEEKMMIDKDGKALAIGNLKDYLQDEELDINELIPENDKEKGRLKGVAKEENDKTPEKDQEENNKEDDEEKVNQELEEQGVDLRISNFRKITDTRLHQKNPEVFGEDSEHAIGYSETLGSYVVLEKEKQGKGDAKPRWNLNQNVGIGGMNFRSIVTIDEKGDKVEKKVPYALLKTNRSDKEIAITLESKDYGKADIETVNVMPCGLRVGRSVRTEGEEYSEQGSQKVADELDKTNYMGVSGENKVAHAALAEMHREGKSEDKYAIVDLNQIKPSDYIKDKDGKDTEYTWEDIQEATGENLGVLIERYNREVKSSNDPEIAIETIVNDYQNINHEHRR